MRTRVITPERLMYLAKHVRDETSRQAMRSAAREIVELEEELKKLESSQILRENS